MMVQYALPVLLARDMGEIRGKTRFQKLLYIIQKRYQESNPNKSFFAYEPYYYGPFSSELAQTIDELVDRGMLTQKSTTTAAGYTVVIYGLTPQGDEFLGKVAASKLLDQKITAVVNDVAKNEGGMPLADLVAAAKAL